MNKKSIILCLASAMLLSACAGNNSGDATTSDSPVASSDNTATSETQESLPPAPTPDSESIDSNIGFKVVMFGDLYPNQMRSIYAVLDEGKSGNVVFESDNEEVVRCTNDESRGNQALLGAVSTGEATISAYFEDSPTKIVTKKVTVKNGTALPESTFNKLTGGMKVTMSQSLYDYNDELEPTLYKAYDVTTIYEEVEEATFYHNTDAYQITVTDRATGEIDFAQSYVRNGVRLATEYVNSNNEIGKATKYNEDGDEYKWVNSYYENLFKFDKDSDLAATVTASDFETYDGGKTYHYVGNGIWATTYLTVSLVMSDITPDDFVITVDGDNLGFYIVTDPASETGSTEKGGTVISGKVSEIGTAKIDHLQPYSHESYHDGLEAARKELAEAKNYTTVYTLTDDEETLTYTHIFTEDTIEEKVVDGAGKVIAHDGAHKTDSGYFTYEVDDSTGTVTKTKDYTSDFDSADVRRYPTFDFAVEILGESEANTYVTRGAFVGDFFRYCWYLPTRRLNSYNVTDDGVTVTLKDGHLNTMQCELSLSSDFGDDNIEFFGTYSNIGTSKVEHDWTKIETPDEPTNFPAALLASLEEWGVDEVIPYLYPTNTGFAEDEKVYRANNKTDSTYARYAAFKTNKFETAEQCSNYITQYKALLVERGWRLTEEADENFGYYYYADPTGEWKLSVGENAYWSGGSHDNAVLFTFNNKDNKMVVPDSYSLDD